MLSNDVTTAPSGHRLRSVITGGESLDSHTSEWGQQFLGLQINEMYGQTEANFIAGSSSHWPRRKRSLGRAYPGHRIAVLDATARPCPPGEPGEIALHLHDPVAMLRYWDNEAATAAKMHDGWLFTGDLATSDADGYLRFAARNDDIINSAGYRIGPAEVENCLRDHPRVLEAAVIGVPDALRGQRVKAVVVVRGVRTDLEDELRAHTRARLGHYQYPREFTFVSKLPKTTTGKIRRKALRDGWELGEGRDYVLPSEA
jgi:acetyl-CoA synthetase